MNYIYLLYYQQFSVNCDFSITALEKKAILALWKNTSVLNHGVSQVVWNNNYEVDTYRDIRNYGGRGGERVQGFTPIGKF